MRLLTVAFVSSEEFLSHYRETGGAGALFVRTRTDLSDGEAVLMEIAFPGLPNRALVRGVVAEPTTGNGAWIRFHAADASTRDFLLQLARGEIQLTPTVNRAFERFPAELPVDCRIDRGASTGERLVSRTVDVGAGGAFIRSLSPPPVGTRVQVSIGPAGDGFDTITLAGDVAWVGGLDGERGFGVRFQDKTKLDARVLRAALRRASESGRVNFAQA